jgi:superfamily II DNA or RNA helicase
MEERREIMRDFKLGRIRYLFNVGVATEGFDAPSASLVIMGRPTKSRSLYAQMAGRGTRVVRECIVSFPGRDQALDRRDAIMWSSKPDMVIMDFVGNSGRHSLMGPEDLLGGDFTPAEIEAAKKKRDSVGGDVRSALEHARRELQRIAGEMSSRVQSTALAFDPFSCMGVDRERVEAADIRFGYIPATERQRAALKAAGMEDQDLQRLSKQAATKLMGTMIKRKEFGLAHYAQIRALRKLGIVTPVQLTSRAAALSLEYVLSLKGFPPDPQVLNGLLLGHRMMGDE